ncbi:MAG: RNA polymerase subunit sigma, partial [Pseudomonadota bacterium]
MPAAEPALHAPLHTLYRDHHGWLQGGLRKKLGNAFDAADLAQDT